jgi:predicted ATPase
VITEFHAKDYGPLKDVSCKLTPLHAFIGPNDSGKSTLLRGLVTAVNRGLISTGSGSASQLPTYYFDSASVLKIASGGSALGFNTNLPMEKWDASMRQESGRILQAIGMSAGARLCRFDADALRNPSSLIEEKNALDFIINRGAGLPGVLDHLNNRADDALRAISAGMTKLFPSLARIQLRNISTSAKKAGAELADGTRIYADSMSEGILYYLAYACVRALGGGSLLAVEEPETGLHPARIAQVIQILREISESGTQVVIATHSPLVVNELKPDEVSVVTRTDKGTQVRLIRDTPNFEDRAKVYALGELWVSYANGVNEAPLFEGNVD